MDSQTFFNVAIALIAFLGGWIMNNLKESMNNLRVADEHLTSKVQAIELLVAGQYVKRDDLKEALAPMATQLNRIEEKLDHKADK